MKTESHDLGPPVARSCARQRLRGVLRGLGRLLGLGAGAGLALKWIGEVVSDRYVWSQWLEWTPNAAVFALALVVLATGAAVCRLAGPGARARRRGLWAALWTMLAVHGAYTVAVDAPFYRRRPQGPASLDESVRVAVWNAAASEREGWETVVAGTDADVVVLVGVTSRDPVPAIMDAMGGATRLAYERFTVLSRLPMRRFAFTTLNIQPGSGYDPRLGERVHAPHDPGAAMYLELAGKGESDGPFTIWVVDLPSDISLPRVRVASQARRAIDAFDGQRLVRTADATWSVEPGTGYSGSTGFPTPDAIVGDFNIPRGAASLESLRCGYPDAFDQASTGYAASWPRRFPLWHLDQAFVGPRFRVWRYELRSTGSGWHLMQIIDLVRR